MYRSQSIDTTIYCNTIQSPTQLYCNTSLEAYISEPLLPVLVLSIRYSFKYIFCLKYFKIAWNLCLLRWTVLKTWVSTFVLFWTACFCSFAHVRDCHNAQDFKKFTVVMWRKPFWLAFAKKNNAFVVISILITQTLWYVWNKDTSG